MVDGGTPMERIREHNSLMNVGVIPVQIDESCKS